MPGHGWRAAPWTAVAAVAAVLMVPTAAAQPPAAAPEDGGPVEPDQAPAAPDELPEDEPAPSSEDEPAPSSEDEPADEERAEHQPAEEESAGGAEQEPGSDEPYQISYFLEHVEVRGNEVTRDYVVRRFVPIEPGETLDVDDPAIETIRWRLLGTGWFDDVRLRLRRGSRRGWVVLVIEVEERNTLIIQQLALGVSQGVASTGDRSTDPLPYGAISVAETNLLGLGMELSVTALASKRQQGVRARFTDPVFLGSSYLLSVSGLFANGMEFFGEDPIVSITCPEPDPEDPDPDPCPPEVMARNAVVLYRRVGLSLGTGHDLGASARYTLDWHGDFVDVRVRPDAASETRGSEVDPIDFSIFDGPSFVSTVQLGVIYDRRDDPALPSRGTLVRFRGDAATRLFGSDYSFLRLQAHAQHWVPLPWGGHHLRFGLFAGAIFGDAPFFYKFYASDLSDLIPSRILEMNIDNRAPPDFFGNAVAEMRAEEVAGRLDVEYGLPLYRSDGGIRAINAYLGVGLYALADRNDLRVAIPGYEGLSRIPIDFTFDLGVRADTSVGVFQLGFSTLLGFVAPDLLGFGDP